MTASAPVARPRARWILPEQPDRALVRGLCDELLLPEPICRLLASRGHAPAESAKRYLRPRLDQLLPPEQLLDLGRAVERLVRAIRGGEIILVHGDYDVDGMSSTTLLTKAFRALGGVPQRGIYDHMKTAVDKVGRGKERQLNLRFSAMGSHFLFEAARAPGR